ncbi:MAG: hypothetical protein ACJAVK_001443 [Akkermansiaceae bacterium]|jgi:hypothetical protein
MDKERAKFVLQSFRPDGEDADEPAFAKALELAAKDRELGEWLATERAQDAAFAAMLAEVEIPEDLREAIFEVLEGAQDRPAEFDADFVGALAALRAPVGLRDQILGAMEVEQNVTEMPQKHRRGFFKAAVWTTTAAAVVAVMVAVTVFFAGAGGNAIAGTTPREVEYSAIAMLESPFFSLDLENDRQAAIYEWLEGKNLPSPDQLPKGLKEVKGVGCKLLEIGDQKSRASLICYRKDGDTIHLIMMERKAIDADEMNEIKGAGSGCRDCDKKDEWAVTQWADAEHTYFLLSKMAPEELAAVFE